jgi:hypothetical protein
LKRAISDMKNNKSTGDDNLPIEIFKISEKIVEIFNDIIEKEEILESWMKSIIILIQKKEKISILIFIAQSH